MSRLRLVIICFIALSVLFTGYVFYKSLSNLVNNRSTLLNRDDLAMYPVNLEDSNTLVTVCPEGVAGIACDFYGPVGIQQALDSGSIEHTIFLKSGIYDFSTTTGITYGLNNNENGRKITIIGEGNKTILFLGNIGNRSLFFINGDTGFTLKNLVLSAESLNNQAHVAVVSGNNVSLTIDNVLISGFGTGLTISNSNTVNVLRTVFAKNNIGIRESFTSARPGRIKVENTLFYRNKTSSIFEREDTSLYLHNNIFYGNGEAFLYSQYSSLINNIFSDQPLGVVLSNSSKSMIFNSHNLFYNVQVPCKFYDSTTFLYSDCAFGVDTLYSDPKFISTSEPLDFSLQHNSIAIDAGYQFIYDINLSRSDIGLFGGPNACLKVYGCNMLYSTPQKIPNEDLNSDGKINLIDFSLGIRSNLEYSQIVKIIMKSFN